MIKVDISYFSRAALEIGHSGENDTLPYDSDAVFVKERADDLAALCLELFQNIEIGKVGNAVNFMNGLTIAAERLLVPSGPHGFRITTKIHPFWNLYLNGLGLAIAVANENQRSDRAHSYRLASEGPGFFDRSRSWRTYKLATLNEPDLNQEGSVVIQTDISSFYEHIYHHRLEKRSQGSGAGLDRGVADRSHPEPACGWPLLRSAGRRAVRSDTGRSDDDAD